MKKIFLPALLLILTISSSGCGRVTERGEKIGTVIKFAQEGFFNQTWEGEMIRGGMNAGSGAFSTKPLHFTVNDPALIPQVQAAFDSQKEVVVTYESHFGSVWSSECDDDSTSSGCKYLTSIREVK